MLDGQKDGSLSRSATPTSQKQTVNTSNGSHPYNASGAGIAENSRKNIKTCFVLWHTVTIALGFAQFGKFKPTHDLFANRHRACILGQHFYVLQSNERLDQRQLEHLHHFNHHIWGHDRSSVLG